MNKTASKLAASVQRAKTQPAPAADPSIEQGVTPSPVAEGQTLEPQATTRPVRISRAKTAAPAAKTSLMEGERLGEEDYHNGGQPVFPNRIWPD